MCVLPTIDGYGPIMLVIIGAGGHARELLHLLRLSDPDGEVGFVADWLPADDDPAGLGAPYLGGAGRLTSLAGSRFLIGIGSGAIRREFHSKAIECGLQPAEPLLHPNADVSGREVSLGRGTVVCSHVSMTVNISTGPHCHVNRNSTVGHDVSMGGYVTINPGASISGRVTIGDEVLVGAGAVVLETVTIGDGATIGAGAVVTRDVPAGETVVGVPAKVIGQ